MDEVAHAALQQLAVAKDALSSEVVCIDDAQLLDLVFASRAWSEFPALGPDAVKVLINAFTATESVAHLVEQALASRIESDQVRGLVRAFDKFSLGVVCAWHVSAVLCVCDDEIPSTGLRFADPDHPTKVMKVEFGSPAAWVGFKVGDLATHLNGQPIGAARDVLVYMGKKKPGDSIAVRVERDGKTVDLPRTMKEPEKRR